MALLDAVQGLVARFDVGPLTVTRRGVPTIDAFGEVVAAASTTFQLRPVAVHNLTGRDREVLPVAIRNRETIQVYTTERVFAGDGGQAADVLRYQGRDWVCATVLDYQLNGAVWISIWVLEDTTQP